MDVFQRCPQYCLTFVRDASFYMTVGLFLLDIWRWTGSCAAAALYDVSKVCLAGSCNTLQFRDNKSVSYENIFSIRMIMCGG